VEATARDGGPIKLAGVCDSRSYDSMKAKEHGPTSG
jgi:hypothetical protein